MKTSPTRLPGLEKIFSISHEIIANPSLDDILHRIVQVAAELAACESASIMLSDATSSKLNFVAVLQHTDRLFDIPVPIDRSIAGAAFTSNQPQIVNDVRQDPRHYPTVDEEIKFSTTSVLAVPLTFREHKIGVLQVVNKKQGRFDEADVEVLSALAAQATITIEIARLYRQAQNEIAERIAVEDELRAHKDHLEELVKERTAEVQRLAIADSLTGLFNRGHLVHLGNRGLQEAQRYHTPFSAMMLDVDRFKIINDTYGHAVGDEALRKLADIFRQKVRAVDIVGRYGGDEFVILMPHTNLQCATGLADRLLKQIRALRIDAGEGQTGFTTSIGVVEMRQDAPETLEGLINRADQATYAAKDAGRDRVYVGT